MPGTNKVKLPATLDSGLRMCRKFDSCRAYWLVVNTLLRPRRQGGSAGLLMHWLSRADSIPLEHGETSFFRCRCDGWLPALDETGTLSDAADRVGWRRISKVL